MKLNTLIALIEAHKEYQLYGRYIANDHIQSLIQKHALNFKTEILGHSVLQQPIYGLTIGNGPKRILMWSQMHGNESTTTKAIFDLLNIFSKSQDIDIANILSQCTIGVIPILNPDGAKAYTRFNANKIDLNRDAQLLSQPESIVLRSFFEAFKPHYCLNLHGQRTLFSAGKSNHPATVSFLAPAEDEDCSITVTRKVAMEIIVRMNENLQSQIPNRVGVYDDAFNINCVGDVFQKLQVPTILFEAGHAENDYDREIVRGLMAQSLIIALLHIGTNDDIGEYYEAYFEIPENEKQFFDVIIRNAVLSINSKDEIKDIAIQYEERLVNKTIEFIPRIEKISKLNSFFGHKEINANKNKVLTVKDRMIQVGAEIDFVIIKGENISLKVEKIEK